MLQGAFVASGAGILVHVHGIMNKEDYVDILKANLKTFTVILALITAGSSSKAVT